MDRCNVKKIQVLIEKGKELPLATQHYPSRGQTAIQKLYLTPKGKFFLKKTSKQNHIDCQVEINSGSIAQREYWAYCLAEKLKLNVPCLWLIDPMTSVQVWLDYPDARQYSTFQGKLVFKPENIFDCALFDWLTGQVDRHDANYLYNYVVQDIILIDSAHCFLKYTGSIPDYLKYFEGSFESELAVVRKTSTQSILSKISEKEVLKLVPLKLEEERSALVNRLKQLREVQTIQEIIQLYRRAR